MLSGDFFWWRLLINFEKSLETIKNNFRVRGLIQKREKNCFGLTLKIVQNFGEIPRRWHPLTPAWMFKAVEIVKNSSKMFKRLQWAPLSLNLIFSRHKLLIFEKLYCYVYQFDAALENFDHSITSVLIQIMCTGNIFNY